MYDPATKLQSATWLSAKKQKSSESKNAKPASEYNVDCIVYAKGIIHHEFVPKNRL
jgi:hypothetical protein